jgi:hypothetical protein
LFFVVSAAHAIVADAVTPALAGYGGLDLFRGGLRVKSSPMRDGLVG